MDAYSITLNTSSVSKLLLKAGWAPLAVFILHAIVIRTTFRQALDFPIHFAGGATMAFFLFYAIACFAAGFDDNDSLVRYLFSFALACTVGLFWEYGELFSDVFLHTHIQHNLHETMKDLIADTSGAFSSLSLVALVRRFNHKSKALSASAYEE